MAGKFICKMTYNVSDRVLYRTVTSQPANSVPTLHSLKCFPLKTVQSMSVILVPVKGNLGSERSDHYTMI